MNAIFFTSPAELRQWLEQNHDKAKELWIGFYKKAAKQPTVTQQEVLDQMLAFGWIDGIRKTIDEQRYTNRYTPRRRGSNWSAVNIRRVGELNDLGLMHPAKSEQYSAEREAAKLPEGYEAQFRGNEKAWNFFQAQHLLTEDLLSGGC